MSETRTIDDMTDGELKIDGYKLFRVNGKTRNTGGVCIYTRDGIKVRRVASWVSDKTWILTVAVNENAVTANVSIIYKSPREKNDDFLKIFEQYFEKNLKANINTIVVGDMNIDVAKQNNDVNKYLMLIKQFGMNQIINEYTRESKNSKTIIDHVLCNRNEIAYKINKTDSNSDHFMIELEFKVCEINKRKYTSIRSFKNFVVDKFSEDLNDNDFECTDDLDIYYEKISKSLKESLDKNTEIKSVPLTRNKWYSKELFELKKEILRMKKEYRTWGDECGYLKIKELMKKYKNKIKIAKNDQIKSKLIEAKGDQKKIWATVKSLYSDKTNEISCIKFKSEMIYNKMIMPNKMNEFFVNSIKEIVDSIPSSIKNNYIEKIPITNSRFELKKINIVELRLICLDLIKKSFHDELSGKVICDAVKNEKFCKSLLLLINECISRNIIPNELKISLVTPLPKINEAVKCEDFRPINNLPVIEKIIETVILNQIKDYVHENDIMCDRQFGFRKKMSTEDAVNVSLVDWFDEYEKDNVIVVVSLDLKRAFETIDRKILLQKLRRYGFKESVLELLKNYLENRFQVTKINNILSDKLLVDNGVPQGSKLSNILFSLFINDIALNVDESMKVTLFADDTLLYCAHKSKESAIKIMNKNLENISDWLKFNRLALNVKKCNAMIINDRCETNYELKIDDKIIEANDSFKYLGVILDKKLKFHEHFEFLSKKIAKKIGLFRRLRDRLNVENSVMMFKSLILPHINYCGTILDHFNMSQKKELQLMINKILRIALKRKIIVGIDQTSKMMEEVNIISVEKQIKFNVLKYMKKIELGYPKRICEELRLKKEKTRANLRYDDHSYIVKNYKKTITRKSLLYAGMNLLNKFKIFKMNNVNVNIEDFLMKNE